MIKTFWNESDYNTFEDGQIKNVNGSFIFVPYMNGTEDPIYKKYIKELLKIDWLHHNLWLVGGILEGWPTTDIDICVTGKAVDQTRDLMLQARSIGPFDVYWVKNYDKIFKGKDNGVKVWKFAKEVLKIKLFEVSEVILFPNPDAALPANIIPSVLETPKLPFTSNL